MNEEKILNALKIKMSAAIMAGANQINSESIPLTPVWKGELRRAKSIKQTAWDSVDVISGNAETKQYLEPQYNKELRHRGTENKLQALQSVPGGKRGQGKSYIYGRAYRYAIKNDIMTKLPAPQWYSRIMKDDSIMARVINVAVRAFRK